LKLSFDYGFLRNKDGQGEVEQDVSGQAPMLVMHDSKTSAVFGHLVPQKGTQYEEGPLVIKKVMDDMNWLGYKRAVQMSDGEPAILALLRQLKTAWDGELVPEKSPEGESQSNGAAEKAVQSLKAQVRTVKDALEARIRQKVPDDHPLLSWMVEYAASVLRMFFVGVDGRTPYQRVSGRSAAALPAEFGERIFYMPSDHPTRNFQPWGPDLRKRWTSDLCLGALPM